ncbi:MAG: ParB/RepB/Spo0J family partition protein [Prochlorotrichaceae cyanobacterium]
MSKIKPKTTPGFELKGRGILGGLISQPQIQEQPTTIAELTEVAESLGTQWIPLAKIHPGSFQPRQFFAQDSIDSLAQSFREQGFKGALNVREKGDGSYEIVAGERRWRAAQQAGLTEVRCIIDEYSDEAALEFALVENLQREDLSKLEETEGILQLIEMKLGITQEQAIRIIRTEGHPDQVSRSDVAPSEKLQGINQILAYFNVELQTFRTKNLRTLSLPSDLKEAHLKKNLPYSSAIELDKIKDDKARTTLLKEVLAKKLSFRDVKERVRAIIKGLNVEENPEAGNLIDRLQATVKQAKKATHILEKAQKRKRLEKLIAELETLLAE